jgi:hypothetical protein
MNKLALLLLVTAMPCVYSQSLKTEGLEQLNVFVTHGNRLFASNISDLTQVDFKNLRAVNIDRGQWQELKNGKGKSATNIGDGLYEFTEVRLTWGHRLDDDHWVVDYSWFWAAGSSNSSEIIQVFELRGGKVYITQQIEAVTHHGGRAMGVRFDPRKKLLTLKAVESDSPKGRCCPTKINILVFGWDGAQFRHISAKTVPFPEDH